jgi:hypothetical protein
MGQGTPMMLADGGGQHELIQDGRWIVGNYWQDQRLPDGTFVLKYTSRAIASHSSRSTTVRFDSDWSGN